MRAGLALDPTFLFAACEASWLVTIRPSTLEVGASVMACAWLEYLRNNV